MVLDTWVGHVVGLGGYTKSPSHGSVTRQDTTGFGRIPAASCIYTWNLLACGKEGWGGSGWNGTHLVT